MIKLGWNVIMDDVRKSNSAKATEISRTVVSMKYPFDFSIIGRAFPFRVWILKKGKPWVRGPRGCTSSWTACWRSCPFWGGCFRARARRTSRRAACPGAAPRSRPDCWWTVGPGPWPTAADRRPEENRNKNEHRPSQYDQHGSNRKNDTSYSILWIATLERTSHKRYLLASGSVAVHADDVVGDASVLFDVDQVQHDEQQIETRQQRILEKKMDHRVHAKRKRISSLFTWRISWSTTLVINSVACGSHARNCIRVVPLGQFA